MEATKIFIQFLVNPLSKTILVGVEKRTHLLLRELQELSKINDSLFVLSKNTLAIKNCQYEWFITTVSDCAEENVVGFIAKKVFVVLIGNIQGKIVDIVKSLYGKDNVTIYI